MFLWPASLYESCFPFHSIWSLGYALKETISSRVCWRGKGRLYMILSLNFFCPFHLSSIGLGIFLVFLACDIDPNIRFPF